MVESGGCKHRHPRNANKSDEKLGVGQLQHTFYSYSFFNLRGEQEPAGHQTFFPALQGVDLHYSKGKATAIPEISL